MSGGEQSDGERPDIEAIRLQSYSLDELAEKEQKEFEAGEDEYRRKKFDLALEADSLTNQERSDNLSARKKYAFLTFVLLCFYVVLTYATVIACGHETCPVNLSDAVLIALITSGTVNIIGMFLVVLNYLFPR